MFKKVVSIMSALVLTFLVSTTAFAAEVNNGKIKTTSGKYVDKSEVQKYINRTTGVNQEALQGIQAILDQAQQKQFNAVQAITSTTTSEYGAAWAYTSVTTRRINCYGYASRFNLFLNPGDIANKAGGPISQGQLATVDQVAQYVINDLVKAGRNGRIIASATAPINSTEYRIAVRVGNQQGTYDYHFMLQCSDGAWCDKPGQTPSRYLGFIDPSNYRWDLGTYILGFYNSNTIFIAVQK